MDTYHLVVGYDPSTMRKQALIVNVPEGTPRPKHEEFSAEFRAASLLDAVGAAAQVLKDRGEGR